MPKITSTQTQDAMPSPTYQLRFFFDPGSDSCVWAANEAARAKFGYAVPLEDLPISPGLLQDCIALTKEFDTSLDWDNPGGPSRWSSATASAFFGRADRVAARLQAELGPLFLVAAEHRIDFS